METLLQPLYRMFRRLIITLAIISGLAVLGMIAVTATDIVLRIFNRAIPGAYDLVRILAVIAITCSIPYVSAIKGHIAIEFFYHRFNRRGRLVLDTAFRLVSLILFSLLAVRFIGYGRMLRATGQVMPTLPVPVFWMPWLISFSSFLVFLVILYHLFHPGKEFIKP